MVKTMVSRKVKIMVSKKVRKVRTVKMMLSKKVKMILSRKVKIVKTMVSRKIRMVKTMLPDLVEPSSGAGLDPDAVDDGVLRREDGVLVLCQEGGEEEEGG